MGDLLGRWTRRSATMLERLLAMCIIIGVLVFAVASSAVLAAADWSTTETFYELVYRVLLMVIGIELARTLLTHELQAILELLAFVTARKTLKPDVSALDIALSALAFAALLGARRYFLVGVRERGSESGPHSDTRTHGAEVEN